MPLSSLFVARGSGRARRIDATLPSLVARLRELALLQEDVVADTRALDPLAGTRHQRVAPATETAGHTSDARPPAALVAHLLAPTVAMSRVATSAAHADLRAAGRAHADSARWWRQAVRAMRPGRGAPSVPLALGLHQAALRPAAQAGTDDVIAQLAAEQARAAVLLRTAEALAQQSSSRHVVRPLASAIDALERMVDVQRLTLDAVWRMLDDDPGPFDPPPVASLAPVAPDLVACSAIRPSPHPVP